MSSVLLTPQLEDVARKMAKPKNNADADADSDAEVAPKKAKKTKKVAPAAAADSDSDIEVTPVPAKKPTKPRARPRKPAVTAASRSALVDGADAAVPKNSDAKTFTGYIESLFGTEVTRVYDEKRNASLNNTLWSEYVRARVDSVVRLSQWQSVLESNNGALHKIVAAATDAPTTTTALQLDLNDYQTTVPALFVYTVESTCAELMAELFEWANEPPSVPSAKKSQKDSPSTSSSSFDYKSAMYLPNKKIWEAQERSRQHADEQLLSVTVVIDSEEEAYFRDSKISKNCRITDDSVGKKIALNGESYVLKQPDFAVIKLQWARKASGGSGKKPSSAMTEDGDSDDSDSSSSSSDSDSDSDSSSDSDDDDKPKKVAGGIVFREDNLIVRKPLAALWRAMHVLQSPQRCVLATWNTWLHNDETEKDLQFDSMSPSDVATVFVASVPGQQLINELCATATQLDALSYHPAMWSTLFKRVYIKLNLIKHRYQRSATICAP